MGLDGFLCRVETFKSCEREVMRAFNYHRYQNTVYIGLQSYFTAADSSLQKILNIIAK